MQKPVLISVPVPVVSTVPPKVSWSFELNLYLELTVPQVSDCGPLGRLFFKMTNTDALWTHGYFCLFLADGNWGEWGSWGSCSATCGNLTGTYTRSRSCDDPEPANNGLYCEGNATETDACTGSSDACPGNLL